MNLVAGELRDGPAAHGGRRGPAARRPAPDGPVIAGVRPTDLKPDGRTRSGAPRLRAELEVVERLGAESHLIFPVDAPKLSGEAAAAADEATEESDATLLAADNRARFTARSRGGGASRRARWWSSPCRPTRCTCSIPRPARRCAERDPAARRPVRLRGGGAARLLCRRVRGTGSGGSRTPTAGCTRSRSTRSRRTPGVGGQVRAQPARLARGRARDGARAAGERAAATRRSTSAARRTCGSRLSSTSSRMRATPASCSPASTSSCAQRSLDALRSYLATANPLADYPSVRLVEAALRDERARGRSGAAAAAAAVPAQGDWPGADRGAAGRRGRAARRCARRPRSAARSALRRRPAGPRSRRAPRRALRRPVQPVGADRRILRRRARARPTSGRTRSPTSACARWTCRSGWRRSSPRRRRSRSSAAAS